MQLKVEVPLMRRDEIPPGTLYLLILKTLSLYGPLHGYEMADSIQQSSEDILQVEEGSLYPALQRMLIKGWVTSRGRLICRAVEHHPANSISERRVDN